jgi:hypothetical protein
MGAIALKIRGKYNYRKLAVHSAGWSLGELLPTIGVYAIGLMFWDRLIHALI